eukprot:13149000-Ditylum_brightwellii.AAC.1
MAMNHPDKEGSQAISDSEREEEEVELVFREFKEGEDITLRFGTGAEGRTIEVPEPTFAPTDPIDMDPVDLPTTMATCADQLLGTYRCNVNAPRTVNETHDIEVIVKKGDRGGLDLKDIQKLHNAAKTSLVTKFGHVYTQPGTQDLSNM